MPGKLSKAALGPYEGDAGAVGPGLLAIHDARLHDKVEQIPTLAELQDQVQLILLLERLVQLYNVGMVEHLHDVHLVLQAVQLPSIHVIVR